MIKQDAPVGKPRRPEIPRRPLRSAALDFGCRNKYNEVHPAPVWRNWQTQGT